MGYSVKFNKQGNIKIGNMWSFSKLAGNVDINGCVGTCGKYCKGCFNSENWKKSSCYCSKAYARYPSVILGHSRNTHAIRLDYKGSFNDLFLQIKRAKNKPSTIRIHAAGEIEKVVELVAWFELATKFPTIKFYIYTKAFEIVERVLKNHTVPENFFINISVWHNYGIKFYKKWEHLSNIRAFVYDDGYDYTKKLNINIYCPAYNEKGKMNHSITCDKCKICFSNKNKVCGCYSH